MVYADLHVHTKASDGALSLKEVIEEAKKKNIKALAITDHDTINQNLKKRYDVINEVEIITGSEVKAVHQNIKIEILCYFLHPKHNELSELFEKMSQERIKRMKKMIKKFNNLEVNNKIKLKEILEISENSVGRPHFAKTIVNKGIEKDFQTAFDKYANKDGECYVPLKKPSAAEVIEKTKKSGALAVLAHPCTRKIRNFKPFLKNLSKKGLDGCEIYYPYHNSIKKLELNPNKVKKATEQLKLIKTGGSDFHDKENYTLGNYGVNKKQFKKIKSSIKKELNPQVAPHKLQNP